MFPDINTVIIKYKHLAKKLLRYAIASIGLLLLLNLAIGALTIYNYLQLNQLKEEITNLKKLNNTPH